MYKERMTRERAIALLERYKKHPDPNVRADMIEALSEVTRCGRLY